MCKCEKSYCGKCLMKTGDPGVIIKNDGLCNQCSGDEIKGAVDNMRKIITEAMEFEDFLTTERDKNAYDCLLMLSGGKDSINMLDKVVSEYQGKVLAFSINHPFESNVALKNTELCINKLNVEHVMFTPNVHDYKQILSRVFNANHGEDTSCGSRATYKTPCILCTAFMQIKSYLFAAKLGIPYVLYCADPFQMSHIQKDVELVVRDLTALLGNKCEEVFGSSFAILKNPDWSKLPKIIYPYALVDDYNAEEIVDRLVEKGLYSGSPLETHCSLYSLLNYYSYKNFDMNFYAPELAYDVRVGKINREKAIEYVENFKKIVLEIAVKDDLSDEDKAFILRTIKLIYDDEKQIDSMYSKILNLKNIIKEFKVK